MFNFKKKLAVTLSGVLTLAMLAPAAVVPSVAKAADSIRLEDIGVSYVDYDTIQLDGSTSKFYVDTMSGEKVKSTDVYKNTDSVDLTYLNGKSAKLMIYSDKAKKVTLNIAAQPKVTAKYDAEKGIVEVKKGSDTVKDGEFTVYIGGKAMWPDEEGEGIYDKAFYDTYLQKGVTGYVVVDQSGDVYVRYDTTLTGGALNITPASKQAKFKIPAMAKAPKVTLDVNTMSFKLPKGCTYTIYKADGETEVTSEAAASAAKVVNIAEVVTGDAIKGMEDKPDNGGFNLTDGSFVLEVKKAAAGKKPASKTLELIIPTQPAMTEANVTTSGGVSANKNAWIYSEANIGGKNNTVQKGIKITSVTDAAMQVALVSDLSKVNVSATKGTDKIKWKTVKGKKSVTYTAKQAEGKYVIYRLAGVKENKKKGTDMQFASSWVSDENMGKVVIKKAVDETTLSVSAGKITDDAANTENKTPASPCAITVTAKDSKNKLFYEVVTSKKKGKLSIATMITSISTAKEFEKKDDKYVTSLAGSDVKGKFVVVYEVNNNGEVVGYGCSDKVE